MKEEQEVYINPCKIFHIIHTPISMLRDRKITSSAKLVYGIIASKLGNNGSAWPQIKTLAKLMHATERGIIKNLKELVDAGYIKRVKKTPHSLNNRNRYMFLLTNENLLEAEDDDIRNKQLFHDMKEASPNRTESSPSNMPKSTLVTTNKLNTTTNKISSKEDINGFSNHSSSRIESIKKEFKPKVQPTYSKEVVSVFDYYIAQDIIKHKKGTATYYDTLKEIKLKLKTHGFLDTLDVIDTYKQCLSNHNLSNKINGGNKLSLSQLLNNKYGKFEWFDYFLNTSYEQIKKERLNGNGTITKDPHPSLTEAIADKYAYEVLGLDEGYPDLERNVENYSKFKVAGDRLREFLKKNKGRHGIKEELQMAGILVRAVAKECDSMSFVPSPGRLCSHHCWNELIPQYINDQFLD